MGRIKRAIVAGLAAVLCAGALQASAAPTRRGSDRFVRDARVDARGLRLEPHFGVQSLEGAFAATAVPDVGDRRIWLAADLVQGAYYFKYYRLRARTEHGELWTAIADDETSTGLRFPDGDCRNSLGSRVNPTKAQLTYLLKQFERRMYPIETRSFSTPPSRTGDDAFLDEELRRRGVRVPRDYYEGPGRRVVILVDNIRDDNFYDLDNSNTLPPTAGFFDRTISDAVDRHVMTIDSFNWVGNTTATPVVDTGTDPCTNFSSTPYNYEATFAHEFQHLLESYVDRDETIWMDEGLSMSAETLLGYSNPAAPISSPLKSDYVHCLLGTLEQPSEFNPSPEEHCGPENSLTVWGDQTDDPVEIIADYGAGHTFMEMLIDRHGRNAMTFLHRAAANGLDAVTRLFAQKGVAATGIDAVHDWLLVLAVDRLLDSGATLHGSSSDLEVSSLNAMVDWLNDDAYMTPGAPPNGGDFVLARNNGNQYMSASQIDTIAFDGADEFAPEPVRWASNTSLTPGDPALYSGSGDGFDRSIAREVAVPATGASLTFETIYEIDRLYDYGFVQVSTDGGETWTSLANGHTTSRTKSSPPITDHLPGFTGRSGTADSPQWVTETFDLSRYAGRTVLLAFRYMTDPAVTGAGWWIDDIRVGSTTISDGSDIGSWQSQTQIEPEDVPGFTVQLVAWDADGSDVYVGRLPLGTGFQGSLSGAALDAIIGTTADNVGVIVTMDDPDERYERYGPYVLTIDGATQPGGA